MEVKVTLRVDDELYKFFMENDVMQIKRSRKEAARLQGTNTL